jgi:hypothetical protein
MEIWWEEEEIMSCIGRSRGGKGRGRRRGYGEGKKKLSSMACRGRRKEGLEEVGVTCYSV